MNRAVRRARDEMCRQVLRVFEEVWNGGRVELVDEIFEEGHTGHYGDGREVTRDGLKDIIVRRRRMAPSLHYVVDECIVDGCVVATRWSGTQVVADDGSLGSQWGITMWHMRDGKVQETWVVTSATFPGRDRRVGRCESDST